MEVQERNLYIDVLRIVATLMIIFNHTSTFGFALYTVNTEGILYWIYLFLAILIKAAVPIFFMISGSLLLKKEESIEQLLKKRVVRFLVVLIIGSVIHYFYFSKWQISLFSLSEFVKHLYAGGIVVQYWYLYSYLGFLLMLPITRKLAKSLSYQGYIYLIGMYFFMKCLEVFQFVTWHGEVERSSFFYFFIVGENIFYPLLGYFLEQYTPEKAYTHRNCALAILIAIITIMLCCVLTFYQSMTTGLWDEGSTQDFFNTFIFIPAGCIYFCVKTWFIKHPLNGKVAKIVSTIGACTFGVYVFETIYREETKVIFWKMMEYFPALISCGIWVLCAFTLGVFVTFILRHIPIIRKLL